MITSLRLPFLVPNFVFLLITKSHFTTLCHQGLCYLFCDLNCTLIIESFFYTFSSVSGKYTKYLFICTSASMLSLKYTLCQSYSLVSCSFYSNHMLKSSVDTATNKTMWVECLHNYLMM